MPSSRLRIRYWRIMSFCAGAAAGLVFWELILPRFGLRGWVRRTRPRRLRNIAAGFRKLAVRLGGLMIKVGQFLSSRLDVLPPEITEELAGLQDEVPPETYAAIRAVAEAELGGPLKEKFAAFDPQPLATASATWWSRSNGPASSS